MASSSSEPGSESLRAQLDRAFAGSYRIEREIGGGGMSRVFLAEETTLARRVVVKVLSPELAHDLSTERFAREIRLSARLQHPNIVPVLSAGDAAGVPYYTMPFIEGDSLRARLQRLVPGEQPALGAAIELVRDIARALDYAHSMGVVHRDIKPENVLLGYDAAVVADFGVAKALAAARTTTSSSTGMTLTQRGVSLGTPAYMSPEQAAGDPAVDHRADLYAWGVVAYEVLSGAHPFPGRHSVQAMITAHLVEHARPLAEAAPHVPATIAALVMRCLAKNPEQRPASAREIVDAIGALAIDRSEAARRSPSRLTLATIGLSILALGGSALAYALHLPPVRTVAAKSGTAPSSSKGYDAYLRGMVRVGSENPQDNDAAIGAFRDAIAADSALAPAYAELSRAYTIKAFYFAPDSQKKRLTEDAEVAVGKALALDPKSAEAHFARGLMLWTPARRFPHEQAIRAYRQALALDSTLDEAHHQLGLVYLHIGLLDEGHAEIEKALTINPSNALARFRLGVIDLYRGDYEGSYKIFNSTPLERSPTLWGFQTATALFRLGREAEANALIDQYLRDYPKDESGVGNSVRAMMLAKAGRRDDAVAAIGRALEQGRTFGHFHHTAYNIASAYAILGDHPNALRWLQVAADDGFPCYPLFARDALLDGLRDDPAFVALMQKLERDWEERKRTL